jgi:molybdate transport system regulatory protein
MKTERSADASAPKSRRERRVQRLRDRAAEREPDEGAPRIQAAHLVFFHEQGERVFGPGVYDLLVLVGGTGSLLQAAKTMGMSYSKAWRVMRQAEEHLGIDLLSRQAGGPAGGGSTLTPTSRDLVERFCAFTVEADAELERLYRRYFGDAPFAQPVRSRSEERRAGT